MKIYITGLPSGYEVEHLVRLFYPMAPLTLTPPEEGEDCVWAEKKEAAANKAQVQYFARSECWEPQPGQVALRSNDGEV